MAEASKPSWKKEIFVGLATALCLTGTAKAQLVHNDPTTSQVPTYVVEGIALGSKVKADSSAYREYKCGPSDQFEGFTWCQRSRRDSERRRSFEATYSILHSKDGTVVYANRTQQPALLDAIKADRDIQNYSRKLGGPPKITKMPRQSGLSDAIVATWGKIELEPLDSESVRSLAEGKSPKKGLLIDFLGNFTRSAHEGLPIYRIVGGAGFLWAGSFDQKGRGTLRFTTIDASALQPGPLTIRQSDAPQKDNQQSPPQPLPDQAQPATAITGIRDAEATIARLQMELLAAEKAKAEADIARTDAEKVAQQVRTNAEIARKEYEEATNDANAAKEQIEKMKTAAGRPASYVKEIILIGSFTVAILLLLIPILSRVQAASSQVWDAENADSESAIPREDVEGAAIAVPTASLTETESINEDEVIKQLAKTLGVDEPVGQLSPTVVAYTDCDSFAVERQEQSDAKTDGEEGSKIFSKASREDDRELSVSVVPDIPGAEVKEFKPAKEDRPSSQPESAGTSGAHNAGPSPAPALPARHPTAPL